jgi:hypothetical protein
MCLNDILVVLSARVRRWRGGSKLWIVRFARDLERDSEAVEC